MKRNGWEIFKEDEALLAHFLEDSRRFPFFLKDTRRCFPKAALKCKHMN
jgi:hypothetical protein